MKKTKKLDSAKPIFLALVKIYSAVIFCGAILAYFALASRIIVLS